MKSKIRYIVGVDEAGRGPLAGPVAVGVCALPRGFDVSLVRGAKDSKQMSERQREEMFMVMRGLRHEGKLDFSVSLISVGVINRVGIAGAVRKGIARGLTKLELDPRTTEVKLDGLLCAPQVYAMQQTITKGDQTELPISLASIAAKVTRDRYMARLAKKNPEYGFEVHKGYGTAMHFEKIRTHGPCDMHRTLFIRNLIKGK